MNALHGIVFLVLCAVILSGVKLPPQPKPVYVVVYACVLYLLCVNPILGVMGVVATLAFVQPARKVWKQEFDEVAPIVGPSQFTNTLEVQMVKSMTPLVHTKMALVDTVPAQTHGAALA